MIERKVWFKPAVHFHETSISSSRENKPHIMGIMRIFEFPFKNVHPNDALVED